VKKNDIKSKVQLSTTLFDNESNIGGLNGKKSILKDDKKLIRVSVPNSRFNRKIIIISYKKNNRVNS
jgi:hypothetical protein